jgi:cell envelope opacity-associated protein A
MALKTALRELTNLLPSADEAASLAHAYALDTQAQLGQDQTFELTDFTVDDEPTKPAGNGTSTHTNPLKPTSPILPNFGPNHAKAKPVDHPDVTLEDLDFFLGVKEKDLGKAGRERFHNDDVILIAAIKTEIARRKSQQDTDKKEPAKPAESKPNTKAEKEKKAVQTEKKVEPADTRTAPTQDEWSRWVTEVSMTHPAQFKQLKAEFKVNSSDKLPNANRLEFKDKMMILIAEATVPTETAEPQ